MRFHVIRLPLISMLDVDLLPVLSSTKPNSPVGGSSRGEIRYRSFTEVGPMSVATSSWFCSVLKKIDAQKSSRVEGALPAATREETHKCRGRVAVPAMDPPVES